MARPPRIQYAGAFYHIIVRGNQQQDIFLDDSDRNEYLNRISRYKDRCGFVLYAYVLMRNHVHLLIETPKEPISRIMQMINFTYTQYFNRKYHKVGHLFQGRYKSFLCDRDAYLSELIRYIHLNPVRAGATATPDQYPWSSHVAYISHYAGLVDTTRVLRMFSENPAQARKLYINFVNTALSQGKEDKFYTANEHEIVGSERFVEKVERELQSPERRIQKPTIERIGRAIERELGVSLSDMISRSRNEETVFARGVLAGAWRTSGQTLTSLQPVLKRDIAMLSRLARQSESKEGQAAVEAVLKRLKSCNQA